MSVLFSCGKTKKDIDGYINNGNLDEVITFIEKKIEDPNAGKDDSIRGLIKYAIERLVRTQDKRALDFLESLFYIPAEKGYKQYYLPNDILNPFIQNGLTFSDFKQLCNVYIEFFKKAPGTKRNCRWYPQESSTKMETMLSMYKEIENYQYYYQQIAETF